MRPEATSLVPSFKVPSTVFLGCFGKSFVVNSEGMNLILELVAALGMVEGTDLLLFKRLKATCVNDR